MIELKNLEKTYRTSKGSVTAIKDINITINDGEIFGIIGLSGAGKSTLVRCINYLECPTSGQVIIDGKELGSLKTKELLKTRQNIGMVFQGFNLLAQRNVIKNICYPLEIAGMKKADAVKRAESLLELVGLSDKAKAYPSQLSGGQKQRVACARAIVGNPKLVLADEPTGALDSKAARMLLENFQFMNQKLGATILMVTHDAFTASYADRILFIKDGKLFNELHRGEDSRKEFFGRIIEVVTLLGGELNDVI